MSNLLRSLIVLIFVFYGCSSFDVTKYVDPNIGGVAPLLTTKAPTVHRPNSMVRIFPVTKSALEDRYLSDKIYGFALNMPAYRRGAVTEIMPTVGKIALDRNINASNYDHDMEEVHPWHHKVLLEEPNINAEWTTTERTALYKFTYNDKNDHNILFRSKRKAYIKITGDSVIQGWEEFESVKQYFYAHINIPFNHSGTFDKENIKVNSNEISGENVGAYVSFSDNLTPVEVRIGISFIDENQAKDNLFRETNSKSFEEIKNESYKIWSNALNKIRAEGGTERQKRIFYTSLYRCMERMINISEYGRYFSGFDGKVHSDNGHPYYTDDWLWDTYRALHPLMLIIDPDKQADMAQSYVLDYEQGGWMPGFPQLFGDYPAMIGFHSAALLWDTYQKGVRNFNVEKAYEGLKKNATHATMVPWRNGQMCSLDSLYIKHGWFPALLENEKETESLVDGFEKRQAVAVTLEHSFDDWCLAEFAKALGKNSDYEYFKKRSQNYRNLFNPQTGFFAPRLANGNWVEPFSPQLSGGVGSRMYYTENNAWTWNFSVQQDIPGLISLLGGKEAFIKRLDAIFNESPEISKWRFMGQFPDATGLNGMFVAGNEPSMHIPYLYNYAGEPWRTQRRVRQILDMWFDDRPLGIPGDEDGGGLCSWYVFSAMGFFPVVVGSGEYAIGSPFFENVTIQLPDGKIFRITAKNCSKKNKYIQSAELNGKALNRAFLSHSDLMNGGTLCFIMGDHPNKQWGSE
ncbi:MAG: GH92 family glycosyl hydrolase [Bacteroidota bacterium]|nr:GH92 family glycosyl hydrolase [Bacteroidota bacterium]MDP4192285.1 GH92 family glycosyl hydrolase [Bacteroidota bacterium]MDP4195780.1 GH92 family glycosyl hydrolase [Bacteroidota bacterium]